MDTMESSSSLRGKKGLVSPLLPLSAADQQPSSTILCIFLLTSHILRQLAGRALAHLQPPIRSIHTRLGTSSSGVASPPLLMWLTDGGWNHIRRSPPFPFIIHTSHDETEPGFFAAKQQRNYVMR
ncbi:unnamed protein product [Victoria cruziana]